MPGPSPTYRPHFPDDCVEQVQGIVRQRTVAYQLRQRATLVLLLQADILVVPDLEAGNMLTKSLTFMANADAAGIVLGARVPIILTSRADSLIARLASCAVATLVAEARRVSAQRAVR